MSTPQKAVEFTQTKCQAKQGNPGNYRTHKAIDGLAGRKWLHTGTAIVTTPVHTYVISLSAVLNAPRHRSNNL